MDMNNVRGRKYDSEIEGSLSSARVRVDAHTTARRILIGLGRFGQTQVLHGRIEARGFNGQRAK
jgi:hypothetical protein